MTLAEKIMVLYPDITSDDFDYDTGCISMRNDSDGRGDYIASWQHPVHPKPTEEQLAAIEE